jgi:hypothetical protein
MIGSDLFEETADKDFEIPAAGRAASWEVFDV